MQSPTIDDPPGSRLPRSARDKRSNPMPTAYLNLTDLDNRIRDLESRYKVTSYEMLRDDSVRSRISEDALLRWETYVRQRVYLRDLNDHRHSEYLSHIRSKGKTSKHEEQPDELVLVA